MLQIIKRKVFLLINELNYTSKYSTMSIKATQVYLKSHGNKTAIHTDKMQLKFSRH